MEIIRGLDNYITSAPEPDENWCGRCDAVIDTDDPFEIACKCNPDAMAMHCSDCGEELPETADGKIGHCENCCECDACMEAYDAVEKHHEATGEWKDMPVITGEKVYTRYPR